MSIPRLARFTGTVSVLVVVPLVAATTHAQSPPPSPQSPPAVTSPQANPPPAAPQATPSTTPAEKKAAAPAATGNLVGLTAKSSDDHSFGTVQSVMAEPGGKTAIELKVGGFLGFGGHMVAIPDGKFTRVGDTVQVNMTADEVNKLPEVKTQK